MKLIYFSNDWVHHSDYSEWNSKLGFYFFINKKLKFQMLQIQVYIWEGNVKNRISYSSTKK